MTKDIGRGAALPSTSAAPATVKLADPAAPSSKIVSGTITILGALRLICVIALAMMWLLLLTPFQLLGLAFYTPLARRIPVLFHRGILVLFGVRLHLIGDPSANRPLMIVSNHVSWLDIVVLSAVAPVSFVAKADMASWPLIGWLAKMQRTVFVVREARRQSGAQADQIAERLAAHETMILFPEATTTDGNALAPFKTPLFEAAKRAIHNASLSEATVQPIALKYTRLSGLPIGRAERPHVAWPGEIGLGESLLPLVRAGALDVEVRFGAPILMYEDSNRKVVAADTARAIRAMMTRP
ncbi:MAG: lysophospholipid acyltransferase family protein [Pseudomonadota bacterium]